MTVTVTLTKSSSSAPGENSVCTYGYLPSVVTNAIYSVWANSRHDLKLVTVPFSQSSFVTLSSVHETFFGLNSTLFLNYARLVQELWIVRSPLGVAVCEVKRDFVCLLCPW